MTFNIYKHNAYYGFEELPKDSLYNIDDLFVISNLGQLKHVTSFIKKKSIKNCFLVVVYTDVNLAVPQAIHDNYEVSIEQELKVNSKNLALQLLTKIYPEFNKLNSKDKELVLTKLSNAKNCNTSIQDFQIDLDKEAKKLAI